MHERQINVGGTDEGARRQTVYQLQVWRKAHRVGRDLPLPRPELRGFERESKLLFRSRSSCPSRCCSLKSLAIVVMPTTAP